MKHLIKIIALLALLPLSASANELLRVEQIPLGAERFNLEAFFSDRVDSPMVQRSKDPLTHEFLLLGTSTDLQPGRLNVGSHPLLESVEVVQQRNDLLLRVNTKKPLEHLMSRSKDVMVLVFVAATDIPDNNAAPMRQTAETKIISQAEPEARAEVRTSGDARSNQRSVTDIYFTRKHGDAGELHILVNEEVEHEARAFGNNLDLVLFDTALPEELLYVLDVSQFATPVAAIETFRDGRNTRISIRGKQEFRHQLEQIDGRLTLTLNAASQELAEESSFIQSSQPISLNFQDVPVRQLLQILAEENDLNLVASESVTGNITLRLENVPWERALETILRVNGLDKRIDGNILIVAPAAELAEREQQQLQAAQALAELAPLTSAYIQINYAKASEIAAILRTESSDLLTSRGAVTVDDRTNTLLVRDTQPQIDAVRSMVKILDIPVKQVIIEARMVTVRDNISDDLGIQWGFSEPAVDTTQALPWGTGTDITNSLNVNLPVSNPAATFGFQVAKLADGRILDLELSALERENKGEIIASPRITTANQKTATIEQGTEIPYVESASSGATSVSFKKAVLGLEVTPQITPDNRVILDLTITQNTRGDTVTTPTGPAVSIDTQAITTQVLVENGETIVLGGIYQQQILNDITKVPLLGDIPYVGVLFRNESQINEKRELLIFVTPRIVNDMP
ncbi:MAG TPA: type IV pilus secretin PilQ family protein [Pseudidiomarina sp.]|nr:type IV pilus secretin PilQ family protein [Pseudidiomarina sp.]